MVTFNVKVNSKSTCNVVLGTLRVSLDGWCVYLWLV
ncbi:hypothetical protein Goshw_003989 [Gossypium schwendimanii]|uniref:Uncharacterized protein n=1 Tax=Gossypium schwendimanii TaxID=34291 RepID=A0A7J9LKD6_GOSSC|nr:hypothetical protein [Gossypium schwendimanii]